MAELSAVSATDNCLSIHNPCACPSEDCETAESTAESGKLGKLMMKCYLVTDCTVKLIIGLSSSPIISINFYSKNIFCPF